VDLQRCSPPQGRLEPAPRTSLRAPDAAGETQDSWDGFWGTDERYYTRCTRSDGSELWYRITDQVEPGVLAFRRTSYVSVRRTPAVAYIAQKAAAQLIPTHDTNDARGKLSQDSGRKFVRVGRIQGKSVIVGVVR
jgi:hypothetical protein